ncbi:YjjG family noncanonical pyrimidine nucleotidase [Flavobacterium sp. DG1-102-2]|uniref:YjjG family noncanonical pyrimidine nucleotidase n=1 Tax=Flavobacterium sp. DG1-102-2 TaxID=3081663 RepID=UPI002949E436|nr:YjjG family noncanonical pyrimidine nucleotidase [Flavobacterium sp. DG1-102-2]MDV6168301.1 YjjG family noncanonical pyrimidine nucleotidase [Flavobacterium sp. DG1-102-2]
MRISGKKAVFFDLDHTLWDFEKNSAIAFQTIIEKYGLGISHNEFNAHYSPINAKYWKLYRDGEITQQDLRYGRLKDTFDLLDFKVSDNLLHIVSEEYIELLPVNSHLHDGTVEILEYLKSKYSLHIITNGPDKVQELKLRNSNLIHYFDTITNSELAGCKKPHAGIFEYALNLAKAEKSQSVMIGDCIEADVQGALDFGLDAIFYNEHKHEVSSAIKQVNHLLDLKTIL